MTAQEPVPMTAAEVAALPAVVDLMTAARALRIGRTSAYALARNGDFPCPVLRAGTGWRVPTAGLLRVLGLEPPTT
ncbi:MerR family transcriptional regulator [Amycolatopsis panacis]|uniref:DNA-binding protein n=1 Tax=Amycolatopsis panacis TaxID=2340917 RepID=A0A419HJF8_9PSEU|nr:helix-turn-helix domain-containing protein [Amycolatopsis panacis]RJQ75943.1 DNA-binding protein [Amycolatopsis panacis]